MHRIGSTKAALAYG
jgi:hypothetical protein